jgi:hypothetical protein
MGRTSGFVIRWPVTFPVEDGRTFIVDLAEGEIRIRVDGTDEWRLLGRQHTPTTGAVVGMALRLWRETTGEPVMIAGARRQL